MTPFNPHALDVKPLLTTNLMLYKNIALEKNIHLSVVNIPNNRILTDPNMTDTVFRTPSPKLHKIHSSKRQHCSFGVYRTRVDVDTSQRYRDWYFRGKGQKYF